MKPNVELYPYQKIGHAFIKEHKYVIIGDVMGLGKTIQAISVMEETRQVVVVCPAMLKNVWVSEVKKFTELSISIVKGKNHNYSEVPRILVVSYEGLKHIPKDLKPDMVVFDEAHYLKNAKAARTQTAHEFIWTLRPKYCVCLSGTPIRNNVGEFFSLLKLTSYTPTACNGIPIAEKSQYAFSLKFSHPVTKTVRVQDKRDVGKKRSIEITEFKGVRNKDLLKSYLKGKYIRRTAKGVLNLPPLRSTTINLTNKDTPTSKALLQEYDNWERTGVRGEHSSQLKVASAMEKIPHTLSYILNMVEQGEKVVVFSDHVMPAQAIHDTLKGKGITTGLIMGSVKDKDRQDYIDRFQAGGLKVLVCTIKAASVGLTLTAARNMVFNDLSWVPADLEQARKRIHRIGQTSPCMIHYMAMGEIDQKIQEKIIEKTRLIREIL